MKPTKKVTQLKEKNYHIVNFLINGYWYSIQQSRWGKYWLTEVNGKLITDSFGYDALQKREGTKLAWEHIKDLAS